MSALTPAKPTSCPAEMDKAAQRQRAEAGERLADQTATSLPKVEAQFPARAGELSGTGRTGTTGETLNLGVAAEVPSQRLRLSAFSTAMHRLPCCRHHWPSSVQGGFPVDS
ncbi:hypothetical protein KIL84_002262 [Mauremys mutica]|uniref:Uncharacterized protein n=1 Tax=Mauremys mutica TaxID=74926 RepID=A0A9D4AXE5_9SAUR|nr:hypothetical protein KIL84_002262 [Mauremys mutica]